MDSSGVDSVPSAISYAGPRDTNLSIIDEEFVYKVQNDIENFLLRRPNQSVLLFPPVNNFRRFLIHQTCENLSQKYDLSTFSVGQGASRRTIVTLKNQCKFNKTMGVKKQTTDVRINKTNEINLYRPPALRNNLQTSNNDIINTSTTKSGMLLPTKNENEGTKNNSLTLMANTKKCKLQQQQQLINETVTSKQTSTESINQTKESMKQQATTVSSTVRRERRPDRAVYIPRARRSQTTPPAATEDNNMTTEVNLLGSNERTNASKKLTNTYKKKQAQMLSELTFEQKEHQHDNTKNSLNEVTEKCKHREIEPIIDCDNIKSVQSSQQQQQHINNEQTAVDENLMHIEGEEQSKERLFKCAHNNNINNNNKKSHEIEINIEEQELKRASKEMNRSHRRIMKQTFVSDVLEIPEQLPNTKNHIEPQQQQHQQQQQLKMHKANEETTDEDDWDVMYDETGECLDSKIVQEITDAVGKVKLDLPQMDYSMYLSKQKLLEKEGFPHVLEVSNFPAEFKHQDLLMCFSQYKESGFDIKWVDDTHALAVFSSARIAAELLSMGHPFVVLKPLCDATPESRAKAKKCATSLEPYRPRPETCAALARRLVTGALGVRLKTAAAEREKEKRVLKEAKERKLMAAKQRDETWDS